MQKPSNIKCYNCGGLGHKKDTCPSQKNMSTNNKNGKCYTCGNTNHKMADCPLSKPVEYPIEHYLPPVVRKLVNREEVLNSLLYCQNANVPLKMKFEKSNVMDNTYDITVGNGMVTKMYLGHPYIRYLYTNKISDRMKELIENNTVENLIVMIEKYHGIGLTYTKPGLSWYKMLESLKEKNLIDFTDEAEDKRSGFNCVRYTNINGVKVNAKVSKWGNDLISGKGAYYNEIRNLYKKTNSLTDQQFEDMFEKIIRIKFVFSE